MAEVKSGCLSSSSSIGLTSAGLSRGSKGVQVYSYKELEAATNGFSPTNMIGDGEFGVVYRGGLSDGTVAAIKKLCREGKQGERAFRIEVWLTFSNLFSLISFVPIFLCIELNVLYF